jgi:hypothetical protein
LTKTNILFPCPNVPSSPYYFYHYLKGVNPFSVAALEYSSQASRPCPPANTADPRVPSLDVAGLFPTPEIITDAHNTNTQATAWVSSIPFSNLDQLEE